jgi:hypothetical protein
VLHVLCAENTSGVGHGYSTSSGKHTIMYNNGDTERVKLDQVRGDQVFVSLHVILL